MFKRHVGLRYDSIQLFKMNFQWVYCCYFISYDTFLYLRMTQTINKMSLSYWSLLHDSSFSETLKAPPPISLFSALTQFKDLLQSHPCWRIFSVVEPTIWHLGDSPKYEWPIHRTQWSRLAMALLPLPAPYSKQYSAQRSWHFSPKSTKEELEAVPETLKALSLCEMQVLGTSKAI